MTQALISEVNTTLKPGLVDRYHNGSHKDMNRELFLKVQTVCFLISVKVHALVWKQDVLAHLFLKSFLLFVYLD